MLPMLFIIYCVVDMSLGRFVKFLLPKDSVAKEQSFGKSKYYLIKYLVIWFLKM